MATHQMSLVTDLLKFLVFTLNQKMNFISFTEPVTVIFLFLPESTEDKEGTLSCLQMTKTTPGQLLHLIGLMTSTSPAVLPAPLHYTEWHRSYIPKLCHILIRAEV